jgi:hypothetical protein
MQKIIKYTVALCIYAILSCVLCQIIISMPAQSNRRDSVRCYTALSEDADTPGRPRPTRTGVPGRRRVDPVRDAKDSLRSHGMRVTLVALCVTTIR